MNSNSVSTCNVQIKPSIWLHSVVLNILLEVVNYLFLYLELITPSIFRLCVFCESPNLESYIVWKFCLVEHIVDQMSSRSLNNVGGWE